MRGEKNGAKRESGTGRDDYGGALKNGMKADDLLAAYKSARANLNDRRKQNSDAFPPGRATPRGLAKVNPDLVVRDKNGEIYTVRYEAVNAVLLNEFRKSIRGCRALEKQVEKLTAGLQKAE